MMQKVCVIGASGKLGQYMVQHALDRGYEVTDGRIPAFLERHAGRPEAAGIVEMARQEADLYTRYRGGFSYGFYVARKR